MTSAGRRFVSPESRDGLEISTNGKVMMTIVSCISIFMIGLYVVIRYNYSCDTTQFAHGKTTHSG
jgi:hypothetical protein